MLVVADFIQLDWIHRPEFGPGWFVKLDEESQDSDDYKFQLHYNSQSGILSVWNEKREKIFYRVVKNVRDIPKPESINWREGFYKSAIDTIKLSKDAKELIEMINNLKF